MTVSVREESAASPELLAALNHLLPQLSASASPMTVEHLAAIISSPASHLLVARDEGGSVVGALTLVCFPIPTGMRAWIEDVVVDREHRGSGTGEELVRNALALARTAGARTVDLTSRPSREAAHRLYLKSGFRTRDTAVYRWDGGDPPPVPA